MAALCWAVVDVGETAHMIKVQLKLAVFAAQRRGNAARTKIGRLLPGEFSSSCSS